MNKPKHLLYLFSTFVSIFILNVSISSACLCVRSYTESTIENNFENAEMLFVGKSLGGVKFQVLKNFKGTQENTILELKPDLDTSLYSTCIYWHFNPSEYYFVYVEKIKSGKIEALETYQCGTFEIELSEEQKQYVNDYKSLIHVLEKDETQVETFTEDPVRYITILKRYEKQLLRKNTPE